ncbi:MAG: hypothetical protein H0W44_02830 [Gammaproteobacteria bacterium]|nr:hypothetical protein [Gammaproteobacteria bacterium]
MGDIIPFKKPPQIKLADKHKNKILCLNGFHKWQIVQEKQFDVKQGKLVTLYRCQRCAATKSKAL